MKRSLQILTLVCLSVVSAMAQKQKDTRVTLGSYKSCQAIKFHGICKTLYHKVLDGKLQGYNNKDLSEPFSVENFKRVYFNCEPDRVEDKTRPGHNKDTTICYILNDKYINLLQYRVVQDTINKTPDRTVLGIFFYFDADKYKAKELNAYPFFGEKNPVLICYADEADALKTLDKEDADFVTWFVKNKKPAEPTDATHIDSSAVNQYAELQFGSLKKILAENILSRDIPTYLVKEEKGKDGKSVAAYKKMTSKPKKDSRVKKYLDMPVAYLTYKPVFETGDKKEGYIYIYAGGADTAKEAPLFAIRYEDMLKALSGHEGLRTDAERLF